MTSQEFKQLEGLLNKLNNFLQHRSMIGVNQLHDGVYVAIYDNKTHELKDHLMLMDLEKTATELRAKNPIK